MGQPVTVIEKSSSNLGIRRFEINRSITGMGHERYHAAPPEVRDRPVDDLARRLFATGQVDAVHVNSNVITVELARGATGSGLLEAVEDLFIYYRPGVEVVIPEG